MSRHTISHADEIFLGAPQAGGINSALRGVRLAMIHRQIIQNALAGDVDGLVTAAGSGATAAAGDVPIDGAFLSGGIGVIATPRNIVIDSTNAGDTSQIITITGTDIVGNLQVENIAANGVTEVAGKKAFATVTSINNSLVFAGNLTVGTSITLANIEFGLDAGLSSLFDIVQAHDGSSLLTAEGGTFTVADTTSPATAVTGDTKGTYSPGNLPDGVVDYILVFLPILTKDGYGQNFTG